MAVVQISGVYVGSNVQKKVFDGKETTSLYIDIYQPQSDSSEKMVQVKSDDVSLFDELKKNYDMGSLISVKVAVNAYKNKAYFRLLEVVN